MLQLKVIVNKLNKRKRIPQSLPDSEGITGTVNKGFTFMGKEVQDTSLNPALGKWYTDRDGSYYWGGGLIVESVITDPVPVPEPIAGPEVHLNGLPANLPASYRLGVDVSHHNAQPDWTAFKDAGVSFAFIKISEGVGVKDDKAKVNADNAKSKNIRIGYYHFCRPDQKSGGFINDATAEANWAISIIKELPTADLPLVLDLEDQKSWDTPLDPKDYLIWIKTFINVIKVQTGKDCMIYSRTEYLDRKLPASHGLGYVPLWISAYPSKPDCNKVKCPQGWNDWAIWQYTDSGSIGKNPKLDINIMKDRNLF